MGAPDLSFAQKIFIGHGQSPAWKDLRDFLSERLHLDWIEFNRDPVAGLATKERLEQMMGIASFALLVMTGEDEQKDGTLHPRDNVVHELGLFQGKLGFTRAIVLLEEGCAEFSNIVGLTQIRFPKGNVMAISEEIRRVLERELPRVVSQFVTTEVRFDYLPDSPTKHGWKLAYGQAEPEEGAYSSPADAPVPGCLSINTAFHYALDYSLPPTVCDGLQFDAQYADSTMIFTRVGLRSKDKSLFARKWIKYYLSSSGDLRAAVTEGYPDEYTLWWPAIALPHRWASFRIPLPQAVERTWGNQGWSYESLEIIRIRGSLCISPIGLTSTSGALSSGK